MKVLSLFDGISCALVALNRAGVSVEIYYASEIEKDSIAMSENNHKNIIRLGDVKGVKNIDCDLLIGGSPCQDLSIAKRNRQGLQGAKSALFWEYIRIMRESKPKFFILENVASMSANDRDAISEAMGVKPIMFCASLVSAQRRKRLFWTNIKFDLPEPCKTVLNDILLSDESANLKSYCLTATYNRGGAFDYLVKKQRQLIKVGHFNKNSQANRCYSINGLTVALSALGGGMGAKTGLYETSEGLFRKLHPIECERLQGLPDNYTEGFSNNKRYKALGNAFNVDVVAHIVRGLK